MKVGKHTVVSLNYRLTDDSGQVLDSSTEGEPLAYIHGTESLIPGLEKELDGHETGDQLQVRHQAGRHRQVGQNGVSDAMTMR